jgi:alkylation response protein AidB-like acyl-CoA dehydrogenase
MQLSLTDDQVFFRDTSRRFLSSACPLATIREFRPSDAGFDADFWRKGVELGWTSLLVPERFGGGTISGDGVGDLTLICYEFGARVAPGPLIGCNVVALALAAAGAPAAQEEVLASLLSGEAVAAWAWGEPAPHDRLGLISTRAENDGDGFVLTGVKSPVEAGAQADWFLVTALVDDKPTQFLVPATASGLTVTPLRSIDMVRRYARVTLDGVSVGREALVGAQGGAAADVERQLQLAAVLQCAEMLGAADTIFAMTLEWAFDRYSFGRPLASYQAIKHRFADLKLRLETSHALADRAARLFAAADQDAPIAVSAAKAYAGHHLCELAQQAVQLHGGIGVTYEHDLHLYLRRLTANRLTYGTPAEHLRRIGALRAAQIEAAA